ncbi:MAG: PAS domain-containing sensor histidine kinase [Campylobacterota bacterium]|nr:PAS domain-containing sensor histidine kinase [Campylobacterota bacterium]
MNIFKNDIFLKGYIYFLENLFIVSKTDQNGIITFVNDKFCELSGYSRDELIGQSHNIVRNSQVSPSIYKELWQTIKSGNTFEGVIKNRAKNGDTYIVEAKIFPHIDENNILHYVSIRTDITQYALDKEKQILNASEKLKIVLNPENFVVDYNQKAIDSFPNLKIGNTFHSAIKTSATGLNSCTTKHFSKKIDTIIIDMLFNNKQITGEVLHYKDKIFKLKIERLSHDFILSFTDITAAEKLKLQHHKKMEESKDKMLLLFTHELKTPLNGIIGFSEILSKRLHRGLTRGIKEKDINNYIEMSDDIYALGNMLSDIVLSLLDSAKLKAGKYDIQNSSFVLSSYINNLLEIYSRIYNKRPQTSLEEFTIHTDKNSILHIFTNLYSNALKYGNGEVFIDLKQIDSGFELRVEDNGDGIKNIDKNRIFDMFDQLDDKELTRESQGTGIGLYLVKQLCILLDFDIKIEKSTKLGGVSFIVKGDI